MERKAEWEGTGTSGIFPAGKRNLIFFAICLVYGRISRTGVWLSIAPLTSELGSALLRVLRCGEHPDGGFCEGFFTAECAEERRGGNPPRWRKLDRCIGRFGLPQDPAERDLARQNLGGLPVFM
jgi:hypothetical protein